MGLERQLSPEFVRRTAGVGDVIFDFAANSPSQDNRLIYIARVTGVEEDSDYYEKATLEDRGDRIYSRGGDGRVSPRRALSPRRREPGHRSRICPEYERARVLIGETFATSRARLTPRLSTYVGYPRLQSLFRWAWR